jgi:hypothetical protein
VRVDQGQPFSLGQSPRFLSGFVDAIAREHPLRTQIFRILDLREGGVAWHHDGGGNTQSPRMVGDALGMVTCGNGDNACACLTLAQLAQLDVGATILEGTREFQVFELQEDVSAGDG